MVMKDFTPCTPTELREEATDVFRHVGGSTLDRLRRLREDLRMRHGDERRPNERAHFDADLVTINRMIAEREAEAATSRTKPGS